MNTEQTSKKIVKNKRYITQEKRQQSIKDLRLI